MSLLSCISISAAHLASRTDMKENLDCMLDKLDRILELARDVYFMLKRIESRDKSRHIHSVPSDDVKDLKNIEEYA